VDSVHIRSLVHISLLRDAVHNLQVMLLLVNTQKMLNVQYICSSMFQARTMIPIGRHYMIFLLLFLNK